VLQGGNPGEEQGCAAVIGALLSAMQVIAHYAQRVVSLNADKPQNDVAKQIDKALSA
jgi:hypothetical protein